MSAIQNDPIYLLPNLYIIGLNISVASTTVLGIAPGMCRDSQNVIDIEVIVTKTVEVEKTVDKSPSSS